ncbi:uncharacterized protein LOC142254421 isoform X2 [Anomaloglossus baeobatrachus]
MYVPVFPAWRNEGAPKFRTDGDWVPSIRSDVDKFGGSAAYLRPGRQEDSDQDPYSFRNTFFRYVMGSRDIDMPGLRGEMAKLQEKTSRTVHAVAPAWRTDYIKEILKEDDWLTKFRSYRDKHETNRRREESAADLRPGDHEDSGQDHGNLQPSDYRHGMDLTTRGLWERTEPQEDTDKDSTMNVHQVMDTTRIPGDLEAKLNREKDNIDDGPED